MTLHDNPPWVAKVLAEHYDLLESKVPPEWLPQLSGVRSSKGRIIGRIKEYGCGAYGCVIPTLDPGVVLKLTTDDTEADFATTLAHELAKPICVDYEMAIKLSSEHKGKTVYLLWRESAQDVGGVDKVLGERAQRMITVQHAASQAALKAMLHGMPPDVIMEGVRLWLEACEVMARQTAVPELRELGDGMVEIYAAQRIFFGDVHGGNVGRVTRDGTDHWVITDPGNIVVIGEELELAPPRRTASRAPSVPQSNPSHDEVVVDVIMDAARKVAVGHGRHKALIVDVWDQLGRDGRQSDMTYDEFKGELVRLFRASKLVLSRVDLPRLYGVDKTAASEIDLGGATFNLINLPQEIAWGS